MMRLTFISLIGLSISIANGYAAPGGLTAIHSEDLQVAEGSSAAEKLSSSRTAENAYKSESKLNLLPLPLKNAESVNLEKEAIPSKILTLYDDSQKKLADNTDSIPVIDATSESEKYGNTGDMFDGISRTIVNGYEAFSNLLNTLIQKPKDIARSISKGITTQLDVIGGKLVGL